MPSFDHELQVRLFHNHPDLAPRMLRDTVGFPVPHYARAELGCSDHTKLKPTPFKSDNVVVLYDETGARKLAIITEVQLRKADDKPYSWPLYAATVWQIVKCPVKVMVLCPDAATERWARTPITFEFEGATLTPAVIGPSNTPEIKDPDQARELPELAVLSAAAHGDKAEVLKAAEAALDSVPEDTRLIYNDFILSKLNVAARRMWEDLMTTGTYEWQSDFARKYVSQGRELGLVEKQREDILRLLDGRGIAVSPDDRVRINACDDLDQLETWFNRAITATSVDEVFD